MSMKNSLILAGIEPATFRFVAQHLNHRATAVPSSVRYLRIFSSVRCVYLAGFNIPYTFLNLRNCICLIRRAVMYAVTWKAVKRRSISKQGAITGLILINV